MAEANGSTFESIFPAGPDVPASSDTAAEKVEAKEESASKTESDESKESSPEGLESKATPEGDEGDKKEEVKDAPADKEKVAKEKKATPAEKSADEWENDSNPFKKRYKDTHTEWNKTHQQNLALQNQLAEQRHEMAILKKKAEGTWTEADEKANEVSPEQVASSALYIGKSLASRNAAFKELGEEKVNAELTEFNSLFANHTYIQAEVEKSDAPVYKALEIMERYRFEKEHGSSPKEIRESLFKQFDKEMRKQITEEVTAKLLKGKRAKDDAPTDHSDMRGGANSSGIKDGAQDHTPFDKIFN